MNIDKDSETVKYQMMKDLHEMLTYKKIEYFIESDTLLDAVVHNQLSGKKQFILSVQTNYKDSIESLRKFFSLLGYILTSKSYGYDISHKKWPDRPYIFINFVNFKQLNIDSNDKYVVYDKINTPYNLFISKLYPLKLYKLGPLKLYGPNQYKNYLSYNFTEWSTMERIESEYPKNLKKRVEKIFN